MALSDAEFSALLTDAVAEADELITLLATLTDEQWQLATPAEGWTIHDQVVHLAFFDDLAAVGFTEPDRFTEEAEALVALGYNWVDQQSHDRAALPPADLLAWFTASRPHVIDVFTAAGPSARTPWFGPPMSAASSATARLMETWAHGQDIYDALGVEHPVSDRLRHICHLGVITRGFSYAIRKLDAPDAEIRVELVAPDGSTWTWGPDEAPNRVEGSGRDFALVVTQRRNIADTALQATAGPAADWLAVAQAFAGNVGTGREAGRFAPKDQSTAREQRAS
ncbi:TIGR03084 family metal-binding protein [soil metagenome]